MRGSIRGVCGVKGERAAQPPLGALHRPANCQQICARVVLVAVVDFIIAFALSPALCVRVHVHVRVRVRMCWVAFAATGVVDVGLVGFRHTSSSALPKTSHLCANYFVVNMTKS